ncbi:MAG: hypothetical protein QW745_02115 [Thermoplasmata archaeon]
MKRGIWIKISLIAIYIVIILFIASIIYPFPTGKIKINEAGTTHYVVGDNLSMSVLFNVENNGQYAIDNLYLKYSILNNTIHISDGIEKLNDLIGNTSLNLTFTSLNLTFKISLKKIQESPELNYLLFHSTNLALLINLSGNYAYGFIKFLFSGNVTNGWDRLIYYNFSYPYLTQNSTNVSVFVPFIFVTPPFIHGNATLFSEMVLNGTIIKVSHEPVIFGTNYSSSLKFVFPISEANYLNNNSKYIYLENYLIYNVNTIYLGVIK